MPDIVRLRNIHTDALTPAAPGVPATSVEPDCLIDFPGVVVEDGGDCFVIEAGNPPELRAWPKSRWANETPASSKKQTKE